MSHRPHSVAEDIVAHPGDRRLTTHWHPGLAVCETLAHAAHGTNLRGPPSLAINDVRGLVSTQAPQSRAVNLFNEETKSSPLATYVALCEWT